NVGHETVLAGKQAVAYCVDECSTRVEVLRLPKREAEASLARVVRSTSASDTRGVLEGVADGIVDEDPKRPETSGLCGSRGATYETVACIGTSESNAASQDADR